MTPRERANPVAERLLGTTGNLTDEEWDDQQMLEELDDMVMLCDTCGWWCETWELDDDQNCGDCQD